MVSPANLFRMLTEFVFILLGGLFVYVGLSRRFLFDPSNPALLLLDGVLVYWGARALAKSVRGGRTPARVATQIGAASLILVGLMMLSLVFVEYRWVGATLASAGLILSVRGLAGAVLALRAG
jgi:hypothetical protein